MINPPSDPAERGALRQAQPRSAREALRQDTVRDVVRDDGGPHQQLGVQAADGHDGDQHVPPGGGPLGGVGSVGARSPPPRLFSAAVIRQLESDSRVVLYASPCCRRVGEAV